ncbi:hypothetical protein MATR_02390 [Marivirga tractuosa]|uniref:Uncharacterized protein n=1 Tax=Marivirga tractuosa (strain ATCC 23168 / DSM 4126 / NBRC 15989 / NCIMB 1408 / VKM B-1430 / H-43) TaxID=643867 RepID=E4TV31_MARTH|nr:hypothetical protein [Marivirga tractuosa]ADR22124.1 hypothetical protein Ftrac_2142 [Marivirga tractuosa DSM 4126]BDD13414.1 hypothetical protein MATR_02390 [Marivirga tractuosa]
MVISLNSDSNLEDFEHLLEKTVNELNVLSKDSKNSIEKLSGIKLEPYIKEIMAKNAIGTAFENTIELIGGQKFPDIIANKYFGVEVKTTTKNHWKTTGNSVLESTRVEDVERIFMLFGKLGEPIEFKFRKYEECLAEVVVTHSPRYLIDMELEEGKTIFDKIKIPYDEIRMKSKPIQPIVNYYKNRLKPGQDLWWIGEDDDSSKTFVINIWKNLSQDHKSELMIKSMIYFPEIFGNSNDKFARIAIWLVKEKSIVCPNLRDVFTAGGKKDFKYKNHKLKKIPKIYFNLLNNIQSVFNHITETDEEKLSGFWNTPTNENSKIDDWIELILINANFLLKGKLDTYELILHQMKSDYLNNDLQ